MPTPTLATERLILRPIRLEDADIIQKTFPHWELVKYMTATIPWPYSESAASEYLESIKSKTEEDGTEYHWAITEAADPSSTHIGSISLFPNDPTDNRGFWLSLDHQGKGYMKEAVRAVNDFAFDVLKMPFMILNNAAPNLGSRRMKELSGAEIISIQDADYISGTHKQERWRLDAATWRDNRHRFFPFP